MATRKKEKESFEYQLELLDNGITIHDEITDYTLCEKYRESDDDDKHKYDDVCNLIGKELWDCIVPASERMRINEMNITIIIEER